MTERVRTESERLPWLESPRAPTPSGSRRNLPRAPIYGLIAFFLLASVGVIAFLAGRVTVPVLPTLAPLPEAFDRSGPVATMTLPPATPVPAPPITKPAPSPPVTEPVRPSGAERARSEPGRVAAAPRVMVQNRPLSRPSRARPASDTRVEPAAARHVDWPPPPLAGQPGQVIQLGAYADPRQADAALGRLVRAYPYLGQLPKVVAPNRPAPGHAQLYRLQLGAGSSRDAIVLCRNLLRIGRGCVVV